MRPKEKASKNIDKLLNLAGWELPYYTELNLSAFLGVAIREVPLQSAFAYYPLYLEKTQRSNPDEKILYRIIFVCRIRLHSKPTIHLPRAK
jgi:hypothetical protein